MGGLGSQNNLKGTKDILKALDSLNAKELEKVITGAERKALTENILKPIKSALPYSPRSKKGIKINYVLTAKI